MQNQREKLSEGEWALMVEEVDELFPKGVNKDRGKALVLMAKILIIAGVLPVKG